MKKFLLPLFLMLSFESIAQSEPDILSRMAPIDKKMCSPKESCVNLNIQAFKKNIERKDTIYFDKIKNIYDIDNSEICYSRYEFGNIISEKIHINSNSRQTPLFMKRLKDSEEYQQKMLKAKYEKQKVFESVLCLEMQPLFNVYNLETKTLDFYFSCSEYLSKFLFVFVKSKNFKAESISFSTFNCMKISFPYSEDEAYEIEQNYKDYVVKFFFKISEKDILGYGLMNEPYLRIRVENVKPSKIKSFRYPWK